VEISLHSNPEEGSSHPVHCGILRSSKICCGCRHCLCQF